MTMTDHARDYVARKKALGLSFTHQERVLMRYAEHADAGGDAFVSASSVLDWAGTATSVSEAQRRLGIIRGLAVFLHAGDDRHEVPHQDALGKSKRVRQPPRIPSPEEIRKIMKEALSLPPAGTLTPLTFHHVIGLMACTGLRRSESDRAATGRPGTGRAPGPELQERQASPRAPARERPPRPRRLPRGKRKRKGGPCEHLFVLACGRPLRPDHLTRTFVQLARKAGARGPVGEPGLRLHDLRHGFAVRALEGSLSSSRRDVGRHMLALSTTLGHVSVTNSYYYLEATPVLMRQVSEAAEKLHMEARKERS